MGGAEKRFVKTLEFFVKKKELEITVLEPKPSLLSQVDIACKMHSLSSSLQAKGWVGTYVGWMFWIANATIKSLSIARQSKPSLILIPNNTLPNLISGYAVSLILHLPSCVITHHIDAPLSTRNTRNASLYDCYRSIKYSPMISLVKTVASYLTLSLLKRADGIITVSNSTARILKHGGISEKRICVSGNGIDSDVVERVKQNPKKKTYDGIFVGRIAKEKGVFDLLRVWKQVVKVRKNAKLLLVGSGLELTHLRESIAKANLTNNVFVRGSCNDIELYGLLSASKVFIFPSIFEGWGIAVAEALACGLPVVAYDIPALAEVFGDCQSVFLVPAMNTENMTSTILDILDSGDNEMIALSNYARNYAEQFSWEKVARKDLELLRTFENHA